MRNYYSHLQLEFKSRGLLVLENWIVTFQVLNGQYRKLELRCNVRSFSSLKVHANYNLPLWNADS